MKFDKNVNGIIFDGEFFQLPDESEVLEEIAKIANSDTIQASNNIKDASGLIFKGEFFELPDESDAWIYVAKITNCDEMRVSDNVWVHDLQLKLTEPLSPRTNAYLKQHQLFIEHQDERLKVGGLTGATILQLSDGCHIYSSSISQQEVQEFLGQKREADLKKNRDRP